MKIFFNKIHYKKDLNLLEKTLVALLTPASSVYSLISDIRLELYKKGLLKSYKPTIMTVSVGNITTGGTGKTPITAAIANYLSKKGYKTAILSRGYGSKLNSKDINIISDGKKSYYSDALVAGDEPVWLAQNCPQTAVLTSSNRVKIAQYAEKELGCTALIIDDGFQHIKLKRDINIAVVDSEKLFGNKKVLPAGPLRESLKNISRADKIIISDKASTTDLEFVVNEIENITGKNPILCPMKAGKVYNIHTQESLEPQDPKPTVLAFSAIGQPEQFYNLLDNFQVVKTIDFADHHLYKKEDVADIIAESKKSGAEYIITTEKDAVKINNLTDEDIFALRLEPNIDFKQLF